jgi:hypothetical protein
MRKGRGRSIKTIEKLALGVSACTRCKEVKLLDCFYTQKVTLKRGVETQPRSICKECDDAYSAQWRARNPQQVKVQWAVALIKRRGKKSRNKTIPAHVKRTYNHQYRTANKERIAFKNALWAYKISELRLLELFAHGMSCWICGRSVIRGGPRKDKACIDHDHVTGEVRGILCMECNLGIGYFRENSEILERAKQYLASNFSNGSGRIRKDKTRGIEQAGVRDDTSDRTAIERV